MKGNLKAGAIFAGIGGFCAGFEKHGYVTSWAVDNDLDCAKTYRHNFPKTEFIERDVRNITDDVISTLSRVDVLHAGFPCQSFSQAGNRRGFKDERGELFFDLMRIIRQFGHDKPSVLVFENAPYLRVGEGGAWFIEIQREIKKAGYWFRPTNCAELDPYRLTHLPQMRNRLFMVAFASDRFKNGRIEFPSTEDRRAKRLSSYVNFSGHQDDRYYLPRDNRYYSMISKYVDGRRRLYQLRKYMVRAKDPDICPTLTANMGKGGHNVPFLVDTAGLRKLTEYECAHLQGFPHSFRFPDDVAVSHRYAQVGNSVCVPIAAMLAERIREKIQEERDK